MRHAIPGTAVTTESLMASTSEAHGKAERDLPNAAGHSVSAVPTETSTAPTSETNGQAESELPNGAAQPVRAASAAGAGPNGKMRDSSWLELEICRDFLRQSCPRVSQECRFAHPQPPVVTKDGKVTCCYDFLKVSCDTKERACV